MFIIFYFCFLYFSQCVANLGCTWTWLDVVFICLKIVHPPSSNMLLPPLYQAYQLTNDHHFLFFFLQKMRLFLSANHCKLQTKEIISRKNSTKSVFHLLFFLESVFVQDLLTFCYYLLWFCSFFIFFCILLLLLARVMFWKIDDDVSQYFQYQLLPFVLQSFLNAHPFFP